MEVIKNHPYISIGALLATVAVVFYAAAGSGGGATVISQTDPNAIAAGTALQQSQMQQQVALTSITAGLQAEQGKQATAVALADIQGKYSYDIANLSSGVQLAGINASAQTTQLQSTLDAQSKQAAIKATTDQASINSNTQIQTTATVANALIEQSRQNAQVSMSAISAANACHGIGCWF